MLAHGRLIAAPTKSNWIEYLFLLPGKHLSLQILNAEVIDMQSSELWRVFAETGDPMAYLLYRSAEGAKRERSE